MMNYLNKIKDLYNALSKIKFFFHGMFSFNRENVTSKPQGILQSAEDSQTKNNDQIKNNKDIEKFYDALEEQEEEFYDALEEQEEGIDTQDVAAKQQEESKIKFERTVAAHNNDAQQIVTEEKKYENNKYYSLQSGMEEKKEVDDVKTLALAFQIDAYIGTKVDLSTLKLQEIQPGRNEYSLRFTDNNGHAAILYTSNLTMYFPKFFEKHGRSYANAFTENASDYIVIGLKVPTEANILTEKASWLHPIARSIQSQIPESRSVYLPKCEKYMRLNYSMYNNNICLFLGGKATNMSGIPSETNWPIRDVLMQGRVANQIGIKVNSIENVTDANANYIKNTTDTNAYHTTAHNNKKSTPVKDYTQVGVDDVQTCKMQEPFMQPRKSQPLQSCNIEEIYICVVVAVIICMSISVYASLVVALAGLIIVEYYLLKHIGVSTQVDEVKAEQPMIKDNHVGVSSTQVDEVKEAQPMIKDNHDTALSL